MKLNKKNNDPKVLKERVLYTRRDKQTKKGKIRTRGELTPFVSSNLKKGRQTRKISLRQVLDKKGRKRNQIYIERMGNRQPLRDRLPTIISQSNRRGIKYGIKKFFRNIENPWSRDNRRYRQSRKRTSKSSAINRARDAASRCYNKGKEIICGK